MAVTKGKTAVTPKGPGFVPVIVKKITLPLLKFADGRTLYFRAESKIFTGKDIKQTAGKDSEGKPKKMEPAQLMNVVDLATGEDSQIIVGAVLKGNLEEHYPKNTYVGRCFQATQHKIEGKRYKNYTICEIEDPKKK